VLAVRESASRPDVGVVTVRTEGVKQTGDVVVSYTRTVLVYKRGRGPSRAVPAGSRGAVQHG
jgi:acyl dehydratase